MITLYVRTEGGLAKAAWPADDALPPESVWVDLLAPAPHEAAAVQRLLSITVPSRGMMQEIESSSRVYRRGGASYMTVPVVWKADTSEPELTPITLVRTAEHLVTVRHGAPQPFIDFSATVGRDDTLRSPDAILIGLIEMVIDRLADLLERVGNELTKTSRDIFSARAAAPPGQRPLMVDLEEVVRRLGRLEDLNGLVQESLAPLSRVVAFLTLLYAEARVPKDLRQRVKTQARDIASLSEHAIFMGQKGGFLLDATLGLISLQHTKVTKIMSVLAAMFLPPTVLASIWGMNFEHMPELNWPYGYLLALAAIVVSGFLPYWYFKQRHWL